jgi:hypothetical protein
MIWMKDEFEDTKGIIISVNRRTDDTMALGHFRLGIHPEMSNRGFFFYQNAVLKP